YCDCVCGRYMGLHRWRRGLSKHDHHRWLRHLLPGSRSGCGSAVHPAVHQLSGSRRRSAGRILRAHSVLPGGPVHSRDRERSDHGFHRPGDFLHCHLYSAGFLRDDRRNNESALKYFLLGSFATAFLLYGIAWIYGLVGSTNLEEIRRLLSQSAPVSPIAGLAAALMFVGFGFKVSIAPFQIWAPDVYQGAAAPVSAFLSAG